jgi:thiol:disulfide interchange protein DsbD
MRSPARFLLCLLGILILATSSTFAAPPSRGEVKTAVLNYSALPVGHQAMAAVVVEIHEGFHAQSHTPLDPNLIKFEVTPSPNPAITFGEPRYPAGRIKNFPALGLLSIYTGRVAIFIPLDVKADAKPGPLKITGDLHYQVCDNNVCYPPEQPKFSITTEIVPANADVKPNEPELFKGSEQVSDGAPATQPVVPKASGTSGASPIQFGGQALPPDAKFVAFLTAFLVGIIFNVMPCVLPVLPLKAIGFYEVSQHNRGKSVAFGAVFSLGLIATFATFGLLIFVFHAFDWGGLFTKTWFIAFIVIVLLGMAVSTFGWFTVAVPTRLYNISPRHDTFLGNFEFGILTALLSTPCTFGMFVGLLAWAITQPPIIGVMILVTVGVGMASPYFLLSAMPEVARRFPRTGPWAEVVKQMMGFLLLLAAVYFARPLLSHFVHGEVFWWLPFTVVVVAAIYLISRSFMLSKTWVPRLVGTAVALLLVAGSLKVVLQLTSKPFVWLPYSVTALDEARAANKIVLVEFTADWCGNCQYVEAHVLHSTPVVTSVRDHDVVMLKADVTREDAAARPLLDKLNPAGSIPLTVIYPPGVGEPIELTGIYTKEDLQRAIELAARAGTTTLANGT